MNFFWNYFAGVEELNYLKGYMKVKREAGGDFRGNFTLSAPKVIHKVYETIKFSCETAQYGKNLISVFQYIFASTDKTFISRGALSTRQ